MKDNKLIKGIIMFLAGFGLLVLISTAYLAETNWSNWTSMLSVVGLIKSESLYADKSDNLIEGATAGIVESLNDPYSKYLNKSQWEELKLQLDAEFGGIGIYVVDMDGKLTVVAPIKDTPAARAGLKDGDIITKINGESTAGMSQDDAVHLMRGDPGTQLKLTVYRSDDGQEHDFTIVREIINVPSVEDKIISEKPLLGYIKLNQFHARSAQEMAAAVNSMDKKQVKGIILDLRDNGGGDFDASLDIADLFLGKCEVVSVKDARGRETVHEASDGGSDTPLIVLVNENSASASEILSGALQDNGRAILVGQKTFGKGLVQTVYPLSNGGALKLTTQKYFTPKGTDINEIGISPDYVVENPDKNSSKDPQLERAVELLTQQVK